MHKTKQLCTNSCVANASPKDPVCQFNKLKPPKFGGGTDPLAYEEWLRRMENLF